MFIAYDLILLVLFVLFVSLFLYKNKKNLRKEGLLFLYKTPWGIQFINTVGKKYKRTLKIASYISVGIGYLLMIFALYFVLKVVWMYIFNLDLVRAIRVPPIMPIVPYIDKLVPGLPSFYFVYWIIILAIIAITHEFAHGIFSVYNKIRIKSTGFGFFPFFFPVFLAAFVELDEKKMQKQKIFPQLNILSAGTFANILTAIFFFVIMVLFFSIAFEPAGVVFDDYFYSIVPISTIKMIGNHSIENPTYEKIVRQIENEDFREIKTNEKEYYSIKGFTKDKKNILLYEKTPAVEAGLKGAIIKIDNVSVKSLEELKKEFSKKKIGDSILITTKTNANEENYEIVLKENPFEKDRPWMGIVFQKYDSTGVMGRIIGAISNFKDKNIYYSPKFDGLSVFLYNLLWWIVLISFSVALINMLPVGIFDGGRFFYLTILGITKNEKIAKRFFASSTYFFLFLIILVMFSWIISFMR